MNYDLVIREIQAGYRGLPVLHNVSLKARKGVVTGVVGPNGAGKSTLLRVVSGLLEPLDGSITVGDADITGLRPDQVVRAGVVQVPEGRQVFPNLTVQENLQLGAYAVDSPPPLLEMYERFPRLAERRELKASSLSGGEQSQLSIARGLMGRPRILLLDEPTLGLSPMLIESVRETLLELQSRGMTILLIEQNLALAMALSTWIYVLERGRILFSGTPDQLRATGDLADLYLGGEAPIERPGPDKPRTG